MTGSIVDEATSQPIAARVYVRNSAGEHFHVNSVGGSAVQYDKRRSDRSFELHTTISAHPFRVDLPAGEYSITVAKGHEYTEALRSVRLSENKETSITIPLKRWTDMSARGWYSGETHVHRELAELSTLQLAEDINVAFPLTAWVTDSEAIPATHNKSKGEVPPANLVQIDKTHVFWPVNTEYEIFTLRGNRHTLGAVFVLNHKEPISLPAPPVRPIAEEAKRQGAFLELDKHNWPWSMMLVPQMNVELYELANNHMWRTGFLYTDWYPEYVARYMNVKMIEGKFTERGWIDFGFENYYALLNCGFKMKPTAGTASGVHPVPFGFGRVYVKLPGDFSYDAWVEGLLAGHSFVTTGPMLTATINANDDRNVDVSGLLESLTEPISLEVLVNGRVVERLSVQSQRSEDGVFRIPFESKMTIDGSSWVAVRALSKRGDGGIGDGGISKVGISFAHTAPVYFDVAGQPLRPTQDQRDYLAKRVRDEIVRSRDMISAAALAEFQAALQTFEMIEVAD